MLLKNLIIAALPLCILLILQITSSCWCLRLQKSRELKTKLSGFCLSDPLCRVAFLSSIGMLVDCVLMGFPAGGVPSKSETDRRVNLSSWTRNKLTRFVK